LQARWLAMEQAVTQRLPAGEPFRALLSEMVSPGLEILVGIQTDPQFGPLVACGPGGSLAEAIGRLALAVPPLSDGQAADLLERAGLARLLRGAELDTNAVVCAIQVVGRFALDQQGQIDSLDINPLAVLPAGNGVRVLDALVVLAPHGTPAMDHQPTPKPLVMIGGATDE
jgi:acetate---CoA ligase (ADP-forming)